MSSLTFSVLCIEDVFYELSILDLQEYTKKRRVRNPSVVYALYGRRVGYINFLGSRVPSGHGLLL